MTMNLYQLLLPAEHRIAGKVFLDCPDREPIGYQAMHILSGRYAAALSALGVVPGERVIAQVEKSAEAVALYLACLRTGAVYVPLNTAYTATETAYFLADCAPRLVVASARRRDELLTTGGDPPLPMIVALIDDEHSLAARAASCDPQEALVKRRDDDLASIIYTSGTTGRAKGAMLTLGNLRANAHALFQTWGWRSDDVLLHALPIFHVHGLFVALHCAMLGGSRVLFHPRFDVDAVIADLPSASVMMGVPTFYTRLLLEPTFTRQTCQHMRLFISGSAPLSPQTFAEFLTRTGHRILERYGMSEAGIITSNPLEGQREPGTVGFPLPDVAVRLGERSGSRDKAASIGELEIRGPNVFAGYWGLAEKTAEEFCSDGFFRTGDLAEISPQGRVSIVGRARDLIISGGYNVYPREVEGHLDELPEIVESAVVGVPHPDLGEAVVAVLVAATPEDFDGAAVDRALADNLARFKHPKRYFVVDALPRNAMGKVQKAQLRERFHNVFD
jgi:malonyl-CoA/methylmalonyl-CoA synthetase